jgi:hypothetical protein
MRTSRVATSLGLVVVAAMSSGCARQSEPAARKVASDFARDVTSGAAAQACALLAPETRSELEQSAGKPCAGAISDEHLKPPGAMSQFASYGTMAQARFARDTVFVAEFKTGWKVMAAGCTFQPGQPYNCQLQGG